MPGTLFCGSNTSPAGACSWDVNVREAGDSFHANNEKWAFPHKIALCPSSHSQRRASAGGGWGFGNWDKHYNGAKVYKKRACVAKGTAEECCKANPEDFEDGYLNIRSNGSIIDCKTYTEDASKCDSTLTKICGTDKTKQYNGLSLMRRIMGTSGLARRCQEWCTEQAQQGKRSCDSARKAFCEANKKKKACACINKIALRPSSMRQMEMMFKGINHDCWMDSCSVHKNPGRLAIGAFKDTECPQCVQVAYVGSVNAKTNINAAQKCMAASGGSKSGGVVGAGDSTQPAAAPPPAAPAAPAAPALTKKTMMIGGAVLVGLLLLVLAMRKKQTPMYAPMPPQYMMAPQPTMMAPQPAAVPVAAPMQ